MKHKTHLSILIGTYSFCAMIYWVSGAPFERGPKMASAIIIATLISCGAVAFYEMFKDIINDQ